MADNIDTQNQSPGGGYFDWSTFSRNLQNNQQQALINQRYNNAIGNMISIYGPNAGAPQSWQQNLQNNITSQTMPGSISATNAENLGKTMFAVPQAAALVNLTNGQATQSFGIGANQLAQGQATTSGSEKGQLFFPNGQPSIMMTGSNGIPYAMPITLGKPGAQPNASPANPANLPVPRMAAPPPRNPGDTLVQEGKLSDGTPAAAYQDGQGNIYHTVGSNTPQPANYGNTGPASTEGANVVGANTLFPSQVSVDKGIATVIRPQVGGGVALTQAAAPQVVAQKQAEIQGAITETIKGSKDSPGITDLSNTANDYSLLKQQFTPWMDSKDPKTGAVTPSPRFQQMYKLLNDSSSWATVRGLEGEHLTGSAASQLEDYGRQLQAAFSLTHTQANSGLGMSNRALASALQMAHESYLQLDPSLPKPVLLNQIQRAQTVVKQMYNLEEAGRQNTLAALGARQMQHDALQNQLKQWTDTGNRAPAPKGTGATNGGASSASPYHNWH